MNHKWEQWAVMQAMLTVLLGEEAWPGTDRWNKSFNVAWLMLTSVLA